MGWVDWRSSLGLLGTMLKFLSLTMLVPLTVAVVYGEDIWVFVVSMALTVLLGLALERLEPDPELGPREALLLVSLAWLTAPIVGAVPFLLAGHGTASTVGLQTDSLGAMSGSIVNALFESTSGFTTTGATVLGEISFERHSHALLMWRQLTQWLGRLEIVPVLALLVAGLEESDSPSNLKRGLMMLARG